MLSQAASCAKRQLSEHYKSEDNCRNRGLHKTNSSSNCTVITLNVPLPQITERAGIRVHCAACKKVGRIKKESGQNKWGVEDAEQSLASTTAMAIPPFSLSTHYRVRRNFRPRASSLLRYFSHAPDGRIHKGEWSVRGRFSIREWLISMRRQCGRAGLR